MADPQGGTFTATTQTNSKEHYKSITMRSGRVIESGVDENEKKKERSVVEEIEKQERKREEEEKEDENNKSQDEIVEKEKEKEEGNTKETSGVRKNQRTRVEIEKMINPPTQKFTISSCSNQNGSRKTVCSIFGHFYAFTNQHSIC